MPKTRAPSAKEESARQERTPRRLGAEALWNYALRVLAGRACSTGELREKLLRRAERAEDAAPILARLKEYGYLDDRRFAENFSASRLENQGLGKARVLSDLRKRRVAPALAEKAVGKVYGEADEIRLIQDYLGRKYRNTPLAAWLAEPKHLAAAYRRLRSAGFTAANSIRVLKGFAADAELLEGLEEAES
jgi:regulatory protein